MPAAASSTRASAASQPSKSTGSITKAIPESLSPNTECAKPRRSGVDGCLGHRTASLAARSRHPPVEVPTRARLLRRGPDRRRLLPDRVPLLLDSRFRRARPGRSPSGRPATSGSTNPRGRRIEVADEISPDHDEPDGTCSDSLRRETIGVDRFCRSHGSVDHACIAHHANHDQLWVAMHSSEQSCSRPPIENRWCCHL